MVRMKVNLEGPFFSLNHQKAIDGEIHDGMGDLVEMAEGFVKEEIQPGNGYLTGEFYDSIEGEVRPRRVGVVRSLDSREIRTWLERGTRRGVRLRKGSYMFTHARTKLNRLQMERFFLDRIVKRLNG